jgi:hypothetical protein
VTSEEEPRRDPLEHKFQIVPKADPIGDLATNVASDNALQDFGRARANMATILDLGSKAVEDLAHIASVAQTADSYLALAAMITAMNGSSRTALQLHKTIQDLNQPEKNKGGGGGDQLKELHNHVHFPPMSTFDLKEALKALKNGGDQT